MAAHTGRGAGMQSVDSQGRAIQALMLALPAVSDPDARFALLTGTLAGIGFDQVNYGFFDPSAVAHVDARVLFLSTMRSDWLAYYADRALHRTDPHVVKVRQGNLQPYRWGEGALRALHEPEQVRTAQETREAGIRSALCVPLADPFAPAKPIAGMTFGSTLPETELSDATASLGGHIVALAHLFHGLSFGDLSRARLGIRDLTPRERDVMGFLAQGLRQSQIADRLGLSLATVELHLANARHKLKAATLPQALARALRLRAIEM